MDLTAPAAPAAALAGFAAEVGERGPVTVAGGRTQWDVGGPVAADAREVRAPAGIVQHEADEMIVRVRAGTTAAELDAALAERGQMVPLDPVHPQQATIGGILAVGRSGIRRLRYGPVRDAVLELRWVSAEGRLVKGGAPVVKNVSGFDIVRLLVGSLGTLGFIAEAVLRTQPRPPVARWLRAEADPFATRARLHRPAAVLWDGTSTWVLLEGGGADVDAETRSLGAEWVEAEGPPPLPAGRRSLRPRHLAALDGEFVAEIGVGTVHTATPGPQVAPSGKVAELNRTIKHLFDPSGRMNPGRLP